LDGQRRGRGRIEQIDGRHVQVRQIRIPYRAACEPKASYRADDCPGHSHVRPLGAETQQKCSPDERSEIRDRGRRDTTSIPDVTSFIRAAF
jgi:hypothetical protein